MDAIHDHPLAERDGLPRYGSAFSAWIFSVSLLIFIGTSLRAEAGKPAGNSGGKPPGDSTQLLPIRLGLPAGCSSSEGYGMNDGAQAGGQLVVVGQGYCSNATRPVRWQNGSWTDVFSYPISGIANDASNDTPGQAHKSTVVGWIAGDDYFEFVQLPDSEPIRLPRLPDTSDVIGNKLRVSDSGGYITGVINGLTNGDIHGVRWDWNADAEEWQVESLGLDFYPRSISGEGDVIVGNVDQAVNLWLESKSGSGGDLVEIGLGLGEDIDPEGTMVVGHRAEPCTRPCTWFPVPVYWIETSPGSWVRHDLSALDGVDSKAMAVANVDGKLVIVGWGYTRKDAIQRAVAWIPDARGDYGQPIRLDAIDGRSKSWARAVDINSNGVVLGNSSVPGWGHEAVLWILPR